MTRYEQIRSVIVLVMLLVFLPAISEAGGSCGYSVGFYQTTYYSQGTYLTLSTTTKVLQSINVTGQVSKTPGGSFVIDHPLNPRAMLLYYSFVESPDMKNVYDGIAQLDENGNATIELPAYFLILNKDFRYLATAVSGPMPNLHLAKGAHRKYAIGDPVFMVAGGEPNGTISWQVTGIRKDPLALEHPIIPEVDKGPGEIVGKGECLFEPLCEKK